ncbi:hypothetical protein DL95DRAFT_399660, partial [Leptodontidium sp. 2 PMI_412]
MHKSLGMVAMSKRFFYDMFKKAWAVSFTPENIINAFAKPGIWPINSEPVLARIRRPAPKPKTPSGKVKTPLTTKRIRQFTIQFQRSPSKLRAEKGSKALLTLAAENSILKHENLGLRESIIKENQKRKRGKRLNLAGEESSGC